MTAQRAIERGAAGTNLNELPFGTARLPTVSTPQFDSGDALRQLRQLLANADASSDARKHSIWALTTIDRGKSAEDGMIRLADDPNASLRRQALRALATSKTPAAISALVNHVRDPDPSVRFQAATGLGRIGDSNAVAPLLNALNEKDFFARYAVFTALNRIGRRLPTVWETMIDGWATNDQWVCAGIEYALRETYDLQLAWSLSRIASRGALEKAETTTAQDGAARLAALRLLRAILYQPSEWRGEWWAYHPALAPPPPRTNEWEGTVPALLGCAAALNDPDSAVRVSAVEGLAQSQERPTAAALLRDLYQRETIAPVRAAAIRALGQFEDRGFALTLGRILERSSEVDSVFEAAAEAATRIGGPDLMGATARMALSDNFPPVRRSRAIEILATLDPQNEMANLFPLVTHTNSLVRSAAQRAIAKSGSGAMEGLLHSTNSSVELRREIISALGASHDRRAVPELLAAWRLAETRDAAIAALASTPDARAVEVYLTALESSDVSQRGLGRKALAELQSKAWPEIAARLKTLPEPVLAELRQIFRNYTPAKTNELFTAHPGLPTIDEYERYAQNTTGDPLRGERVFFGEMVACTRCHTIAGQGTAIGPDLTLIGAQFPRKDLIENILYPSRVVREGYQQWNIETRNGETYSGLIKTESAEALTMLTSDGEMRSIPAASIAERSASGLSLMPEGLQVGLTLTQFADLIAYLESRRTDPRRPALPPSPSK